MLFRYCLNVILDVILEKHFGNSFSKKLSVDVFQFYFTVLSKGWMPIFLFSPYFSFSRLK